MTRLRFALSAALLAAALAAATAMLAPSAASACSCIRTDPLGAFLGADVVFTGTVAWAVNPRADEPVRRGSDPVHYRFAVDHMYKGAPVESLLVLSAWDGAACGMTFARGRRYLIHASVWNDTLRTGLCRRNAEVERAGEDLDFLDALPVQGDPEAVNAALAASARDSLDHPDPGVRQRALRVFIATADSMEVSAALRAALRDTAAPVRRTGLGTWTRRLYRGEVPLAPILPLLEDPVLRFEAIRAVGSAREQVPDSVLAVLLRVSEDPDPVIRTAAAEEFGYMDPMPAAARDRLEALWRNDPRGAVRAQALMSIPLGSPPTAEGVARLRAAVADTTPEVRDAAAVLLGYGALSEEPWSGVVRVRLLADPDPKVRRTAALSVSARGTGLWRRVRPGDVLPALAVAAQDTVYAVYTNAFAVMAMLGSRDAIPILIHALDDPRRLIQIQALRTLGELGTVARPAAAQVRRYRARAEYPADAIAAETLEKIEGGGDR